MNKIKSILWIILFFFFAQAKLNAQVLYQNKLIAKQIVFYKVDQLGNVYYVDSKNALGKFEPQQARTTKFADLQSGRLGFIDISNPLRILVFYPDFFITRFLDINLTEISNFKITNTYNEGLIKLVCTSNNNGFWIYDEINRKLLKMGDNFKTIQQSSDIFILTGKNIKPNFMIEQGDEVYVNDPTLGVFVFDVFGGYKKTIPILGLSEFRIENGSIVYFTGKQQISYANLKSDTIATFNDTFEKPFQDKDYYYYMKSDSLFMSSKVNGLKER